MSFIDIFSYLVLWKKRNLQYQWCLIFFFYIRMVNCPPYATSHFILGWVTLKAWEENGWPIWWYESRKCMFSPPHPQIINLKRVQWMTVIASWRELMNVVTRMNQENMSFKISKNFISLNIFKSDVNLNKVQCQ